MRRHRQGRPGRRAAQRGWVGLVAILIALVIVALLAQTVLKSYGLLGTERTAKAGSRVPDAAAPAATNATEATRSVTAPVERAREVEQQLQRNAQDLNRRIDEQTK